MLSGNSFKHLTKQNKQNRGVIKMKYLSDKSALIKRHTMLLSIDYEIIAQLAREQKNNSIRVISASIESLVWN